jgi:hypothetical protein
MTQLQIRTIADPSELPIGSLGFAETRDYQDGALRAFVRFGKAGPVQ